MYQHIDPETNEIVYIGTGKNSRAWATGTIRFANSNSKSYGHRDGPHAAWLSNLITRGYLPNDWVTIVHRQLSKEDAHKLEVEYICTIQPRFNHNHNPVVRAEKRKELKAQIQILRGTGLSYQGVANQLGTSTMRVWRCANE